MKFSVVIPAYDHFLMTGNLLMDLYQNCPYLDEILVVDNGSAEKETQDGFAWWKRIQPFNMNVLRLEENVGFLRAANYGLQQASGDIVALISNDVRVHKNLPEVAGQFFKSYFENVLLGGRLLDFDTGWNCFKGTVYPYVEGWALITTKIGWEKLGYFDERYAPNDMEDVDLSTTAVSLGFKLMQFPPWCGEVFTHVGAQTIGYGDERFALTVRNKEKFEEKWKKS